MRYLSISGRAVTVALLVGGAIVSPNISTVMAAGQELNTPAVQQQVGIRRFFGLDSDASFVASLQGSPVAKESVLPIPLTATEQVEMSRRDRVALALQGVRGALAAIPNFAGTWVDPATGATVLAMVAGDDQQELSARSAIQLASKDAGTIVLQYVQQSHDALQAKLDKINEWMASDPSNARLVTGIGLMEMENVVSVKLDPSQASALDVTKLNGMFGSDGLDVSLAGAIPTASWTATGGALAGGQRIWGTDGSGNAYGCSSAFSNTSDGSYYAITAGHCGTTSARTWTQGSLTGSALGVDFPADNGLLQQNPTNCDCVDFGSVTGKQTNAFLSDAAGTLKSVTAYGRTSASYALSRAVCFGGATSANFQCDIIRNSDFQWSFSINGSSHTIVHGVAIYCGALEGDSGGPLIGGTVWLGVESATTNLVTDCHHSANASYFSRTQFVTATTNDTINVPGEF